MVISRPKIWRKVNFCIFLMLESNFWIHWIFFLIFKPCLSQNCKTRESVWTIFEVLLVCLTDEERHLNPIISHHYYLGFGYTTPTSSYSIFLQSVFFTELQQQKFCEVQSKKIDLIWHWHWVTQLIFIMTLNLVLYLHFVANNSL